jgi:asparagine synthase (glutamine-hydrolysing)
MGRISGWFPAGSATAPVWIRHGQQLKSAHGEIWTAGLEPGACRTVTNLEHSASLTVFGACHATNEQLEVGLRRTLQGDARHVRMWPGRYLAVVERSSELVACGDLSGITKVYWTKLPDGWLWSTAASTLNPETGSDLDWGVLLAEIVAGGFPRFLGRTPFRGVTVVPKGSLLRLSSLGASVERWYKPDLAYNFEAGAERFNDALFDSLRCRAAMTDVWSCDFSGGVDSSTLVVLASLMKYIHAVTVVNPWLTREDMECAETIARECFTRMHHWKIETAWELLYFSGLTNLWDPPVTDLPSYDLIALAEMRAVAGRVSNSGSKLHMSGHGGDSVTGFPAASVVDLYQVSRRRALAMAAALARRHGCGTAAAMHQITRLAGKTYQDELHDLVKSIEIDAPAEPSISMALSRCCRLLGSSWLTTKGKELVLAALAEFASQQEDISPGQLHDWLSIGNIADNECELLEFANVGVSLEMPYLDAAVLDAALSMPGYVRSDLKRFKPLITSCLAQWLPTAVTHRTTKGEYGLAAQRGAEGNGDYLRQVVDNSQLVAYDLLDRRRTRKAFEAVILGAESMHASLQRLVSIEFRLQHANME